MKKYVIALLALAAAGSAMAADVGVSVTVGEPGFYGRIDIGNVQRPQVIYSNPMIIQRPVVGYIEQPLYLRVPPGHAKNWSKHCARYDACGRKVYFVQENWYNNVYAPQIRERSGWSDEHGRGRNDERRGDDRGNYRGDNRGDNHGDRREGERGEGHGRGRGHDQDR